MLVMKTYSAEKLLAFCIAVFEKCGMSNTNALQAAEVLHAADLRGIDSHGVARLSGYVRLWESDRANLNPVFKIIHQTPSTATLDADKGLGLNSAPFAMNLAIEKAATAGTGWVAIKNSNHFGIAAHHAMMALPHDMIGITMTNASPLVAPTFSKERMLGTNPICFAIPAGKHRPVVVDMATSAAANGKLEIAQRENKGIPSGWVQDQDGNDSIDADALKKGGALLPLGGHKGYGMSAVVDIFTAVLSGANYGPWVPPFVSFLEPLSNLPGEGMGHFVGALRVDAFRPAAEFKRHMDNWIERFKNAERVEANQPVLIPGEPEFITELERKKEGIPLNEKVVADLTLLAERFAITFM